MRRLWGLASAGPLLIGLVLGFVLLVELGLALNARAELACASENPFDDARPVEQERAGWRRDLDGDSISDGEDPYSYDASRPISAPNWDADGDGMVNGIDPDDDNDLYPDGNDERAYNDKIPEGDPRGDHDQDGLANGQDIFDDPVPAELSGGAC